MKVKYLFLLTILSVFAGQAYAGCLKPSAPELKDGQSLVSAEIESLHQKVETYLTYSENYRACLNKQISEKPNSLSSVRLVGLHNKSLKSDRKYSQQFNAMLKSYQDSQVQIVYYPLVDDQSNL